MLVKSLIIYTCQLNNSTFLLLTDRLQNADVLVDVQNPLFGDVPYTQQLGGCGEPGQKIYMTPNYVATIGQQSNSEEFGNPGDFVK